MVRGLKDPHLDSPAVPLSPGVTTGSSGFGGARVPGSLRENLKV